MNKLSNITKSELIEQLAFNYKLELEHLSYFEALFTAIKNDNSESTYTVEKLASLGSYLSQDFAHYTELELDELNKAREADDE